jgi:GNAT superfamily N-acetyltransferase
VDSFPPGRSPALCFWLIFRQIVSSSTVQGGGPKAVKVVPSELQHRLATRMDVPALKALMEAAIEELQKPYLSPAQIAASKTLMGLDTQLIEDGTYFVIEQDRTVAGCGGWSRRATMYGGDGSPGRNAALLDPRTDAARIRAMYTHPHYVRRGVGRLILELCENAARAEGFTKAELGATMAGEPLYRACGYQPVKRFTDDRGGAPVPILLMRKTL